MKQKKEPEVLKKKDRVRFLDGSEGVIKKILTEEKVLVAFSGGKEYILRKDCLSKV